MCSRSELIRVASRAAHKQLCGRELLLRVRSAHNDSARASGADRVKIHPWARIFHLAMRPDRRATKSW